MNVIGYHLVITCALLLNDPIISASLFAADSGPQVLILDRVGLGMTKQRTRQGDELLKPALAKLIREADRALMSAPLSVTRKDIAPPSGDKHDYMSLAPLLVARSECAKRIAVRAPRREDQSRAGQHSR